MMKIQMAIRAPMAPWVLMIVSRICLRGPMAFVETVAACWGTSLGKRIFIKGLSIPMETSPKTMDNKVKTRYTTNLTLYFERYCRITENFFMLLN